MPAVCPPSAKEMVSLFVFAQQLACTKHIKAARIFKSLLWVKNVKFSTMMLMRMTQFQTDPYWQLLCSDAEFVMVTLSLRFINVTVVETEFTFYNCSLVQQLSGRRP